MVVAPYQQCVKNNIILRWFDPHSDDEEFVWHRDRSNRLVRVVQGSGWKFQFDNEIPQDIQAGTILYIDKNRYHRIIKGSGQLVVEIIEELDSDGD